METLAQLVRKKHPGAYDDLSDSELEAKVDAKFPGAYSDLPRTSQNAPQAAQDAPRRKGEWSGESYAAPARGVAKSLYNTFAGATRVAAPIAAKVGLGGQFPPFRDAPIEPGEEAGAKVGAVLPYLAPGGPVKGLAGAVVQGAKAGLIERAQGGSGVGGAIAGAAGPLVAKLGEMVAPGIRKLAETQYGRALNATTKPLKAESRKVVPQLLDRQVWGTLPGLAEKGATRSAEAGKALRKAYKGAADAGVKSRTAPVIKALEEAKGRFYAMNDAGEAISTNPVAVAKLEAMQELVGKFGEKVRPDQLWTLRKSIDDIIKAGGGFGAELTPGTTKALQREARMALQKELSKAAPNIEELNAKFSLWKGLENVAKATIDRKTGQAGIVEFGLRTGVGGGLGLLLGGGDPDWGTAGALLGAITKHPLYRTVSAVEKARLAHAMAHSNSASVASVLSRLLAGLNSRDQATQAETTAHTTK